MAEAEQLDFGKKKKKTGEQKDTETAEKKDKKEKKDEPDEDKQERRREEKKKKKEEKEEKHKERAEKKEKREQERDQKGEKKGEESDDEICEEPVEEPVVLSHVDFTQGKVYTYDELLKRLYTQCSSMGGDPTKVKLTLIRTMRVGTKKISWVNFGEHCKTINRTPEHVMQYVTTELATEGNLAGNEEAISLIVRGKFMEKNFEKILKKYIRDYVICEMCKSSKTELGRDGRVQKVNCLVCKADRACSAIKSGFIATGKGVRKKAKNLEITQVKA